MYKDKHGNFIGMGEDTVYDILKEWYPKSKVARQTLLTNLLKGDWLDDLSERQQKETLDLVIFTDNKNPIVIRVQDKHHSGSMQGIRDVTQKKILQWNDIVVVDVQHYNCPEIFKEKNNNEAWRELKEAFGHADIKI